MGKDPLDATLFANWSLCWLRLREGERALSDARDCRALNPRWAKAWDREGAALSLLKVWLTPSVCSLTTSCNLSTCILTLLVFLYAQNYKAAADAFVEA